MKKTKMTFAFSNLKKVLSSKKGDTSNKQFIIDDDTRKICNDIRKLNINTGSYNIWNVYCLCKIIEDFTHPVILKTTIQMTRKILIKTKKQIKRILIIKIRKQCPRI